MPLKSISQSNRSIFNLIAAENNYERRLIVWTWKLGLNIEIGGYTKKSDKNNNGSKRLQLQQKY